VSVVIRAETTLPGEEINGRAAVAEPDSTAAVIRIGWADLAGRES